MKRLLFVVFICLPFLANAEILGWYRLTTPTSRPPKIYGSHYAGCMDGAKKLPQSGTGFVLGAGHENRAYGQPEMMEYIKKLGLKADSEMDRTIIINDIASPRGGPPPRNSSLHQSHQTGLDVDIWFRSAKPEENSHKIKQVSMLDASWGSVNHEYWNDDVISLLKQAASFDEVDRIFVNPVIKRELCKNYSGETWMHKVRPWWGHAAHFHVRLKCPANSPDCKMQKPVKEGDGCDSDLDWWFTDEAKAPPVVVGPKKDPELPKECMAVFKRKR